MTRSTAQSALLVVAAAASFGAPVTAEVLAGEAEVGLGIYGEYCASCHGRAAEGAPNWQVLDENGELPAPPHDSTGHTWRHTDTELFEMIANGWRDPFNRSERPTMPGFRDKLTANQIRAVIAYLKTHLDT